MKGLKNKNIEPFVKYNYFHKEQKRAFKNNLFHPENLYYNSEKDYFICPIGQHMVKIGTGKRTSGLGYVSNVTYYQAKRCEGCPLQGGCHKSIGNRTIEINHQLRAYKTQVKEKLLSDEGIKLRKQRAIEPEAVFGQLKSNNTFNRFKLRGLPKVTLEFGLAAISHNLRKLAKLCLKNPKMGAFQQYLLLYQQYCYLYNYYIQLYKSLYRKKISESTFFKAKTQFQKNAA